MEQEGFWTNMVTGDYDDVSGLDALNVDMTPDTQATNETVSEVHEVDVALQRPESAPRSRGSRPYSKRSKNFDPKEDEVVCSAWLNVSKDPIHGANQSRSSFWSRIHTYFEEHKETTAFRTESSIMHRWLTIQEQVNKNCACYEAIEGRHQSGVTIKDKISQALEMYQRVDKDHKTFTLIHCWNKLNAHDKWKLRRKELADQHNQAAKKKQKTGKESTASTAQLNKTANDIEISAPDSEVQKRPQGQKKAKEALRRGAGEACMEALDKMWAKKEAFEMEKERKKEERFMISLDLEKKRVAIEEKNVEDRIMSKDMASLTPLQREYYEMMQREIIDAKRLTN